MSKKIFRKAAVIALSAATIMTFSFASVFADVVQSKSDTEGTDAAVYLTVQLTMGQGTAIPAQTHKFIFVQDVSNSIATQTLSPVTVSYTAGGDASTSSVNDDSSRIKHVYKQSAQIASGSEFSQPGLYTYTVGESVSDDSTLITQPSQADSTSSTNKYRTSYLCTKYKVRFYVAKATGGGCYIKAATVSNSASWNGAAVTGTKIDPSVKTDNKNNFIFQDIYYDLVGNTDNKLSDSNMAFAIKNNVDDKYKMAGDGSITYTLMTNKSVYTYSGAITGNIYTRSSDGTYTKVSETATTLCSDGALENNTVTVTLKPDQYFIVESAGTGTHISVTDPAATGNVISYESTTAGKAAASVTGNSGVEATTAMYVSDGASNSTTHMVNGVIFNNTWAEMSVTGVVVENMPFILMGIALAGAAMILIMRRRKQDEE